MDDCGVEEQVRLETGDSQVEGFGGQHHRGGAQDGGATDGGTETGTAGVEGRAGGARSYKRNGVWRVEGERAQQLRERAAKRGRAMSMWLRKRRKAAAERQRNARVTEAKYKA